MIYDEGPLSAKSVKAIPNYGYLCQTGELSYFAW